ncbi:hypothetical protein [Streptomyces sp. NBC_00344]
MTLSTIPGIYANIQLFVELTDPIVAVPGPAVPLIAERTAGPVRSADQQ